MQAQSTPMPATSSRGPWILATAWILLVSGWILAGALFKLLSGSPALLPEVVRRVPLELGVVYNLAIGIELAIALAALAKPRLGWLAQALLLLVFDAVLATQIAAGAASCGCFGSQLSVPPWVMLALDSAFLAGLVALRPWSRAAAGLPLPVPAALAAAALAVPWFLDRELAPGEVVADGRAVGQPWIELDIEDWIGKDLWETPLGREPLQPFLDLGKLPLDGLWVFWRATCDHCATHLEHLAESESGGRLVALIQLEEQHDTLANRVVHLLPDGNFVARAALPARFAYILQTPGELLLEGGRIVSAVEGATPETGL
jgi:hypothetical protein